MSLVAILKGRGPSGFGANSTAEEVTEGLDLRGRHILVTGCTSGLGKETARVLAMRGATVLGTARNEGRAREALDSVGASSGVALACELADPASVAACIARIREGGHTLNAIIANAGVMAMPKVQRAHGYELQFFTNHVGHFQLVTGLLDVLAPDGRVVMVSSDAHRMAPKAGIEFDNLDGKRYRPFPTYGQSKLANILFAKELARRFEGTDRTANALHPGVIFTELWRHLPGIANRAIRVVTPLFLKTVAQGAATSCYVAVHPDAGRFNGRYFQDCNLAQPRKDANDPQLAAKLWTKTESILAGLNVDAASAAG
ncbi:MAG TPA: SDR family oxidoreductase [Myxococcaceae bacterium]|nr:SDR family oxidoreductase [Myxococcaceae bacterium]